MYYNAVEKAKTDNAKAWEFYDLLEYCAEQLEKQPSELLGEFYEWLDKKSDEQN